MVTKEGSILITEKRSASKLLVSDSVEKIYQISNNVACAVSGLVADSKFIVDFSRNESQSHWFNFNEQMPLLTLTQSICDLSLRFGEDGNEDSVVMSRPFGVAFLIAGYDHNGFGLYYADPSGTYSNYFAKAIGAGSEVAQTNLDEKWNKELSLKEGLSISLSVLKNIMEEKLTSSSIQICIIDKTNVHFLTTPEIENYINDIGL